MDIGLMVEGQHGLTWERWIHICHLVERLGLPSLFRSDHYFIGEQHDSLELFISLTVAARETTNVRFGPMVTPMTFRSPVDVARMGAQIDLLSGGRFVMGVGAGWNELEHAAYGIRFPERGERAARLGEAIRVMQAMWREGPSSFQGKYYTFNEADPKPNPAPGRPALLIGGNGPLRTLRYVAQYADEWNSINRPVEAYVEGVETLERHCEAVGRDPATIKRSMMTFGLVGPDAKSIERPAGLAASMMRGMAGKSVAEMVQMARERGMITGKTDEIMEQLGKLAEAGVTEVQFQHMDIGDDTIPEFLASEIAPLAKRL
jgi:alkanesulfonate monooxygenase SsuD/methylene tetrahydromethanopterin reductase-like flavin-dependent oxidoreductase (luciferase family)